MLITGDRFEMVNPIEGFNQVGDTFEVIKVLENGTITFKAGYGTGVMSIDEFDKYFQKVLTSKKKEWTDWITYDDEESLFCDGYEYKTNGQKVIVREGGEGSLKASSSCHPNDVFDLRKGYDLAHVRLEAKVANNRVKHVLKSM